MTLMIKIQAKMKETRHCGRSGYFFFSSISLQMFPFNGTNTGNMPFMSKYMLQELPFYISDSHLAHYLIVVSMVWGNTQSVILFLRQQSRHFSLQLYRNFIGWCGNLIYNNYLPNFSANISMLFISYDVSGH